MKRFLLTISLLAILVSSTLAQITLTIEDVNTSVGSNIPIELNATNFNDVGAVSIRITFDPAVLEFVELQNPALTTNLFVGSGSGFLTIGWFNLTPANLGDAKIGDMIFNYFGGTSAISFEVPPTEISNSSAATIALTTVNGSITGGAPPSLGSPTLEAPINGATNQSLTPTLNWSDVATATMYDVQVATEATFTNILVNQQGLAASTYSIPGGTLSNSTTYFWRARAKNGQNTSTWSSTFTFVTLSGGGSGDVSLTIETVTVPPNTEIKVPITVTNFNSIGSVSLRINFDNSKLTFKSLVNKTSKTFTGNAVDDKLNIFWFDATGGSSPLSIGDGDLLEIVFDYTDGNIALSFDQPSCQISNSANQPLTASYTDGTIIEGEALPSVPTLSTPSDNATDVSLTPTL